MKVLFLIQARTGSKRLPKKTLKPIFGKISLVELVYRRILLSRYATSENVIVLTTTSPNDDELINLTDSLGIKSFRGSEENVYGRFKDFLNSLNELPDYFFRVCADNPMLEPGFIDSLIEEAINAHLPVDYLSYSTVTGLPSIQTKYGFFCELINTNAFLNIPSAALREYDKEHVTPFLYQGRNYTSLYLPIPSEIEEKDIKLSVDTAEEYLRCKNILDKMPQISFTYQDVLAVIKKEGQ
jgi:spore coat polysaccharide biosynthesis protein SpsF